MGLASLTAGTRSDFLGKVLFVVFEKRHPKIFWVYRDDLLSPKIVNFVNTISREAKIGSRFCGPGQSNQNGPQTQEINRKSRHEGTLGRQLPGSGTPASPI